MRRAAHRYLERLGLRGLSDSSGYARGIPEDSSEGDNIAMAKNTGGKPLSEKDEKYRVFWQQLIDTLPEDHGFTKIPEAKPNPELHFPAGLTGVSYRLIFAQRKEFSVDVYIDRNKEWNEWLFDQIEERKGSSEFGKRLEWMRLDNRNACRIRLSSGWRCTIDDHPENLRKVREWMIYQLVAFNRVFGPMFDRLAE